MTTRKVTAIEEKVLALAVEWAEKRETWETYCKANGPGSALSVCAHILFEDAVKYQRRLATESKRLLKQRRAKGEKK
jgi:hypothetical protein